MSYRKVAKKDKLVFNKLAPHPLQMWEWGEFRETTGVKVVRYGIFKKGKLVEPIQITIHSLGILGLNIGYLPKGYMPSAELTKLLREVAKEQKCIFIKLEPKVEKSKLNKQRRGFLKRNGYVKGRSLFTKYNFELDLKPSKEVLKKNMKSKTRYNVKLAKRKEVKVSIDNSKEAFEEYIRLTEETTKRQGFYAHSPEYHRNMWKVLSRAKIARLMKAEYDGEILTTWILFSHNDTMYYPYGASSRENREVMANNLVMWEAIKLAKREGYKYFDMWGALGNKPNKSDPWYGFHKFKEGYGARHVEYVGTYDLVTMPLMYPLFRVVEKLRWTVLKMLKNGSQN